MVKNLMYWFLLTQLLIYTESIQVTVPDGILEGIQQSSDTGISFYSFYQIPYGKPPIGDLRFKSPQPAEQWKGVRNATYTDRICYQQANGLQLTESEDCLYLNVYTPKFPSENNSLPVLFYIHGGGFVSGFANTVLLGPHYLMEFNVVVVTINYRLGPFGFLSTGDLIIPGNYGLKDQLLALKWVQANIRYFGGDPTKVTIYGQSAGAAAVGYHLMSPKSNGLFRAAISQSGSILSPWNYQQFQKNISYQLASLVNPNFNTSAGSQELLNMLLNITPTQLINASRTFSFIKFLEAFDAQTEKAILRGIGRLGRRIYARNYTLRKKTRNPGDKTYYEEIHNKTTDYENQIVQGYLFTPSIEPVHEDAFITKRQYSSIKNGKMNRVPLMIGIASEEMLTDGASKGASWDNNLALVVNDNMHITNESQKLLIGQKLRQIYTKGTFSEDISYPINFLSDAEFGLPLITHAKLQSRYSDVYFFRFSYYGQLAGYRPYYEGAYRVQHTDHYYYIWTVNQVSNLNSYPEEDILTSKRYRTLLVNFAADLNPVSNNTELLGINKWPKVKPCFFQYLDINETLTIQKNLKKNIIRKWEAIYRKYAVKPYDTY